MEPSAEKAVRFAIETLVPENDPARSVHPSGAPEGDYLPRWPPLRSPDEERLMFPLIAVILDMYRSGNHERFEHLLRQIGFLIDHENLRANPSLAVALDTFEAIKAGHQLPAASIVTPTNKQTAAREKIGQRTHKR